jgi:hypothetical protein
VATPRAASKQLQTTFRKSLVPINTWHELYLYISRAVLAINKGTPPCLPSWFGERDSSAADVMLQDALVQQTFVANPELQSKLPPVCGGVCLLKLCKGCLIITKTRWF